MIELFHIAAASENNVIGIGNALPWDIPEDMKFFRETTKGHPIIMGRKTFESMGRPLPHRQNIIITRDPNFKVEGAFIVGSLDQAYKICQQNMTQWGTKVFVIGGGEIYKQSLLDIAGVYLTRIHTVLQGDTLYPDLDPELFELVSKRDCEGDPSYSFLIYKRKK